MALVDYGVTEDDRRPRVKPIILDLCGGTGAWSKPYRKAGYDVRVIDLTEGIDVLRYTPPHAVHGVLAAPPCTEFAGSGARWWASKPAWKLRTGLAAVFACIDIIGRATPAWWAIENPVGRLPRYIGPWRYTFQPYEYGDNMTKRTCIWGDHVRPATSPIEPTEGADWVHRMAPGPDRAALRSVTPPGFAQAFFAANP